MWLNGFNMQTLKTNSQIRRLKEFKRTLNDVSSDIHLVELCYYGFLVIYIHMTEMTEMT